MTWHFAGFLLLGIALSATSGCGRAARDRPSFSPVRTMLPTPLDRQTALTENTIAANDSIRTTAVDLPSVPSPAASTPVVIRPVVTSTEMVPAGAVDARLQPDAVWWNRIVGMPLGDPERAVRIDLDQLAYEALTYSDQLNALRTVPLAVAKEVCIAQSQFDAKTFVESKFHDRSDPVSDTLTTGGPPRLNEHRWAFDAGVRQQLPGGATASLSQQLGHTNSNSLFFVPNNQGASRLALNLTQPLLRGAGPEYNRSLIVLAQLDTRVANDDFNRDLQQHLLEISRAYWMLYAERSALVQRQQSLQRVVRLAKELEARKIMDATTSQVVRVSAATARRKADLLRNHATIRNTESLLGRLTGSPVLVGGAEVVPMELPTLAQPQVDARLAIQQALRNRPEVDAAFHQVRAATVRLNVSEQDLLPYLNVVVETYVSGLEGESDVGTAWREQFDEGAPSYTAGLSFEMPLSNHGARARHSQRRLALAQVTYELRNTLSTVAWEVDTAVREVETLYAEATAKSQSVYSTLAEVNHLDARWGLLAGDEGPASLALDDLLQAHERLLGEELSLAQTLAAHSVAVLELRRATGTLLDIDDNFGPIPRETAPMMPEEIPVPTASQPALSLANRPAARFQSNLRLTDFRNQLNGPRTVRR